MPQTPQRALSDSESFRDNVAAAGASLGKRALSDEDMLVLLGNAVAATYTYEEKKYQAHFPHEQHS
jgi:hypothetical protein